MSITFKMLKGRNLQSFKAWANMQYGSLGRIFEDPFPNQTPAYAPKEWQDGEGCTRAAIAVYVSDPKMLTAKDPKWKLEHRIESKNIDTPDVLDYEATLQEQMKVLTWLYDTCPGRWRANLVRKSVKRDGDWFIRVSVHWYVWFERPGEAAMFKLAWT